MGTATAALAAFEVAVARGGAAFAGCEDVGIHAEAHAAAGFAPLEASGFKDRVETLGFGLAFDGLRAGNDHRAYGRCNVMSIDDLRGGSKVFNACIGARAEKDCVDLDLFYWSAGFQVHILERALEGFLVGFGCGGIGEGNGRFDAGDHAGRGAPAYGGGDVDGGNGEVGVEDCSCVGYKFGPVLDRLIPGCALWRKTAAFEVGEGGGVGGDHAGAC